MSSSNLPIVLVTCATGSSSSIVVKALSATGRFRVRATGRNIESLKKTFQGLPNVEFATLDSTPESAKKAFEGVTSVFFLLPRPNYPGEPMFQVWFDAIKASGVKQVLLFSAIGASATVPLLLGQEHAQHEQLLRESSIPFHTILQPGFFFQNVEKYALDAIRSQGSYSGSGANGRYASVDLRDVADVALKVFSDPAAHNGKTYVLIGEVVTEPGIAEHISKASGRKIEYINITPEEQLAQLKRAGLSDDATKDVVVLDQAKREEWVNVTTPDLENVLGKKPRSLESYIKELAAAKAFTARSESAK